ncbi:mediator of RNA polymerase II transcription subunit 15a-like [Solanum pennellii]|uniref:Mediator of RNA polymerase II transcription subunit 15a-like n=1 Tax=Solanum pennellii TaxID=28526 RepID=A0ABM1V7U8_SOLPN|nr:mediator of RNA polymerase II transcription subunit 15a-like [Solanum pennellii]
MENANGADWQEEVYQKIKYMKEMYLSDLKDLYEKIAHQVQQHDSIHHRLQNENIEKLKMFKVTLEHIMLFLRLKKQDIQLNHKGELDSVEKNISFFLRFNWERSMTSSSPQQGGLHQDNISSLSTQSGTNPVKANLESLQQNSNALCNRLLMQQQLLQSQQLMEHQQAMNSLQQLMQPNNFTKLQHNSLSGVSTNINTQQYMINSVQPGFNFDLGQSNSLNFLQQVSTGFLQRNPVNNLQHGNISSFRTQSGTNPIRGNLGSLQKNLSVRQRMWQSQQIAEPATKTAVTQSADAATTFSEIEVNETEASKSTEDQTIANPPDVAASTVFHATSTTTIP